MSQPPSDSLRTLLRIMACLRHPELGCPWDLKQSFATIAPHTLEEACEVIDTIERGDLEHLPEELGDLLFQVVFYARLGEEAGVFDFDTIAQAIAAKLLRRHPHVFPDATLESFGSPPAMDADEVSRQWEQIKAAERSEKLPDASILADVPRSLTALARAAKLQQRASRNGLDWSGVAGVMDKLDEEITELRGAMHQGEATAIAQEYGDLLFTVVNLGRHLGLDAETGLRGANQKFEARVRAMEALIAADGTRMDKLDEQQLDGYWQRVKAAEKQ